MCGFPNGARHVTVPQRLTRKLQQTLGADATEDLVNLLNAAELRRRDLADWREGTRAEFADFRAGMRAEFAEFRAEMRAEFADFRGEMRAERASMRDEWRGEIAALFERQRAETGAAFQRLHSEIANVRQDHVTLSARVEQVKSDLMKWSFLFWVGAVGAIAALAGVLK